MPNSQLPNPSLNLAAKQMELLRAQMPETRFDLKEHAAFFEGPLAGRQFFCSFTCGSRSTPSRLHVGMDCFDSSPTADRLQYAASVIQPIFVATKGQPKSLLARAFQLSSRIFTADEHFDSVVQIRTSNNDQTETFLASPVRRNAIRQLLELGYGRVVHQGESVVALRDDVPVALFENPALIGQTLSTLREIAHPVVATNEESADLSTSGESKAADGLQHAHSAPQRVAQQGSRSSFWGR